MSQECEEIKVTSSPIKCSFHDYTEMHHVFNILLIYTVASPVTDAIALKVDNIFMDGQILFIAFHSSLCLWKARSMGTFHPKTSLRPNSC